MTKKKDHSRRSRGIRRHMLVSCIAGTAMFLAGCTAYEKLASDQLDGDYTVSGVRWTNGRTTLIFMKAYEHEGRLAVCSAYTGTAHSDWNSQGDRQYFDTANIYIGDERIGPLSFSNTVSWADVKLMTRGEEIVVTRSDEAANCVLTDKKWKAAYGTEPISFQGPSRIRVEI